MVIPVSIARRSFSEELTQIQKQIQQINDNMPRKSEYQEKLDRLQDQAIQYEHTIKSQANFISRLLSLNEQLLEYIDNIEEIKSGGGISINFETREDLTCPKTLNFKTITIPKVTLALLEE